MARRYRKVLAPVRTSGKMPEGVIESDCKYPDYKKKSEALQYDLGNHGTLTFFETSGFGWCLATLSIGGRNSDRTYAVRLSDGAQVRIGNGPHCLSKITVYVKKNRVKALKKFTDLYLAGAQSANTTRDRISSRRAQGQVMRAEGRSYWRWDV